ncbi:MAG: serine protease [Cytophagales bacterium]|nr:serine protease [Rhizobacter sp.]
MNTRRATLAVLMGLGLSACGHAPPALHADFVPIIRRGSPAVVGVGDAGSVLGSGFRLENTRLVATAAHVLQSLQGTPVVHWESRRWPARLIGMDEAADIALLEIDADAPMPGLPLATATAVPGEWVLVLGCPFGTRTTATTGIVSALPGAVLEPAALARRLQLNAAVNPGNSGGPVLNLDGQVIAIANATIPGGYGLGFAVPVAELTMLLKQ